MNNLIWLLTFWVAAVGDTGAVPVARGWFQDQATCAENANPAAIADYDGTVLAYSCGQPGTPVLVVQAPAPPPPPPPAPTTGLDLVYLGKTRDRVGKPHAALAPDGAMDGVVQVTLHAAGGRVITRLVMTTPGAEWNTYPSAVEPTIGVAYTIDGPLLNRPDGSVAFTVADGASFVLFGADPGTITSGRVLTLEATFSDGTLMTGSVTIP